MLGDGKGAFLYELHELRPHRVPLGEVSPESLVEALRGNVRAFEEARLDSGVLRWRL